MIKQISNSDDEDMNRKTGTLERMRTVQASVSLSASSPRSFVLKAFALGGDGAHRYPGSTACGAECPPSGGNLGGNAEEASS